MTKLARPNTVLNAARQIERARYATCLLQQGVSILDTVEQAGYFDQPHLTRSLKHYIGQTPAQILQKSRPEQISFLYKTMPFAYGILYPSATLQRKRRRA